MFYNLVKTPIVVKTKAGIIDDIDSILKSEHLYYPSKILITQPNLYTIYKDKLNTNKFTDIILCGGSEFSETETIVKQIKDSGTLLLAFGGGSILDIVKYCANKCDLPYLTIQSTLSNDAIYSCVARLTQNGKKRSFGVNPPTGIIVDLDVVRESPKHLILAGVGDLITNLSAIQDWKLAHKNIGEPINELAYMLAKEAASGLFHYNENDLLSDDFLYDLANGLISSGLSMIISGNTRGTSGAEHLISHAIDEYFVDKSSIHGLQAAWAFLEIEKQIRGNKDFAQKLETFYNNIGLTKCIDQYIPWTANELVSLIPFAKKIRNRYTVFNTL